MFWLWYHNQTAVELGFPAFEGLAVGIYAGQDQYFHDKAWHDIKKRFGLKTRG